MIKTEHKYLKKYHSKKSDTALILGTIHPHNTDNFKIDFFYGNRNSIWSSLGFAFPQLDFKTQDSIVNNLSASNIWISDMILSCERSNEKITQDKLLQNLELNTEQIENGIKASQIKKIFFTSGFNKNNAARLFCDAFSLKTKLDSNREFDIPENIFGRKIKGIVLFSPSGQANIGISKNKRFIELKDKYEQYDKPVSLFKIDSYRIAFKGHFDIEL